MFTPAAAYDKQEVENAIRTVEQQFPDDVERVRYSFHEDWSGDPALYFRVLLKDRFNPRELRKDEPSRRAFISLLRSIESTIKDQRENENTLKYFSFRTLSEQAELRDPLWDHEPDRTIR